MAWGKRAFSAVASVVVSLVLASSLAVGTALADSPYAAGTPSVTAGGGKVGVQAKKGSAQAKRNGWKKTKAGKVYYRNGSKVTGLQKIGKNRYYFNSKGVMKTSDVTVGGATYYIKDDGVLLGAKVGGAYYYNTLKRMSKADAYDFETFNMARSIVKRITDKNDSKAVKLHKSFDWVMNKYYGIHRTFNPWQANWTAIYARDHFNNIDGDCHADAAAFAYLAAAIGYPADVCLDAVTTGTASSHSWCMIGNRVYDPLFAQSKSYSGYYGATSGTYEVNPAKRYRVPQYNPANASKGSKASTKLENAGAVGLKKAGKYYYYYENGKAVKNAWKTVEGKRYYFKSNGRAATLSTNVKGVYYVFDKKGVLQRGSTAGKRLVKVGSNTYQVSKAGKAVAGWSPDRTRRFDKTGLLLTGVRMVGGKLYAADSKGVYQEEKTQALNEAAVRGAKASTLRGLLGAPRQEAYSTSCNIAGDDGLWMYKHIAVTTARPTGASDDGDTFEYVWSVKAL